MGKSIQLRLRILQGGDQRNDPGRVARCWELFRKLPLSLATKISWLLGHKGQLYVGLHADHRSLSTDEHRTLLLLWHPEPMVHICRARPPAN